MNNILKELDDELRLLAAKGFLEVKMEQALLVGSAYEGKPIKEKALVFVFEGKEYLVPFTNKWDGTHVTESLVQLDRAQRIVKRPKDTSCISEMVCSAKILPRAQEALYRGVQSWFVPERGYEVKIVPFVSMEDDRATA